MTRSPDGIPPGTVPPKPLFERVSPEEFITDHFKYYAVKSKEDVYKLYKEIRKSGYALEDIVRIIESETAVLPEDSLSKEEIVRLMKERAASQDAFFKG